jgi:hypothetical protein
VVPCSQLLLLPSRELPHFYVSLTFRVGHALRGSAPISGGRPSFPLNRSLSRRQELTARGALQCQTLHTLPRNLHDLQRYLAAKRKAREGEMSWRLVQDRADQIRNRRLLCDIGDGHLGIFC